MPDVRVDEESSGRWVADLSSFGDGRFVLVDRWRQTVAELTVEDGEVICSIAPRVLAAVEIVDAATGGPV